MLARQICLATLLLVGASGLALAQNLSPAEQPTATPGTATTYPLSTAIPHKKAVPKNPAETAAQRQSGLSDAQARSLVQQSGYNGISNFRAEPNSIWVWQADAMKNGRRVRLGIDYRGNLVEISGGSARPCTAPGAGFGAGPLGTGSRLSEATRCSGQ
jgi:hypothetical protein